MPEKFFDRGERYRELGLTDQEAVILENLSPDEV